MTGGVKVVETALAVIPEAYPLPVQPKFGPQTMVRAASMQRITSRPDQYEQERIAGTLGVALRRLRAEHGLSTLGLARRSAVSSSTVSRLERGLRRPRRSLLGLLAYGLNPDGPEPIKTELCAAAGDSLVAESRWSERTRSRRFKDGLLSGRVPLPLKVAIPFASLQLADAMHAEGRARLDSELSAILNDTWTAESRGSAELLHLGDALLEAGGLPMVVCIGNRRMRAGFLT